MFTMIRNIIASILAFLLMLFPNWGGLQSMYLMQIFDLDIITSNIMNAIETRNVSAFEDMMCQNIKDNVADLPGEIGALIDAIDEKVTEYKRTGPGAYEETKNGKRIIQRFWDINFKTSAADYKLMIVWEAANNFAIEETGIRAVVLLKITPPNNTTLADVRATEGVSTWHD
jgi:hypothetical protein